MCSRDSAASMATRVRAGRLMNRGSISSRRRESLIQNFQNGSWAHPGSYTKGVRDIWREQSARRWSWPLIPSSAENRNEWSSTSTPLYA